MNKDIQIILVKFMIITALTLAYVAIAFYIIAPAITQVAFGDDMWKQFINKTSPYCCFFLGEAYGQYDQFNNPNQYQDPNQFQQNQQFSNDQQYNQGFNQQPYQSFQQPYGTPSYMPQGQYGPYQQPYPQQGYGGFGIQEIITALIAGGGSAIYTKRRTSQLHDDNQQMYAEILKGKQVDAELARITYAMNKEKSDQINDAPMVKLDALQKDVDNFTDKTAKA